MCTHKYFGGKEITSELILFDPSVPIVVRSDYCPTISLYGSGLVSGDPCREGANPVPKHRGVSHPDKMVGAWMSDGRATSGGGEPRPKAPGTVTR